MNLEKEETYALVTMLVELKVEQKEFADKVGRVEYEIIKRLTADGAKAYPHPHFDVTLSESISYDRTKLFTLKELIPPETLSTGFVPEHEETKTSIVPDSWDMRVVLGWKKFGTGVADVIEKSVMKGSPRLSIKAKKKTIEPA